MKISADSSKGRLNCGQTHGKIYSDYLNNFVLIKIVSRGDRVFTKTKPDQEKKKKEEPPVVSAHIKVISHLSS